MTGRGRVLVALAALAVVLTAAGGVLLVADANERVVRAADVVAQLDEFYENDEVTGYDPGPAGPRVRALVADTLVNDAPMPELFADEGGTFLGARYGAFGGVFSSALVTRPWSPRMMTVPIAIGAVLAITVVLIRAAAWAPRPGRSPSSDAEAR